MKATPLLNMALLSLSFAFVSLSIKDSEKQHLTFSLGKALNSERKCVWGESIFFHLPLFTEKWGKNEKVRESETERERLTAKNKANEQKIKCKF